MKKIKKYAMGGVPCPDCKLTQDASGNYKYGSDSTGYTSSSDRETAKKKHRAAYPNAYISQGNDPKMSRNFGDGNFKDSPMGKVRISSEPKNNDPGMSRPPYKKGGPITSMDQVQRMYSKKKK